MAQYSKLGTSAMPSLGEQDSYKRRETQLQAEIDRAMEREGERIVVDTKNPFNPVVKKERYMYKDPELEKQAREAGLSRAQREMDMLRGEQRGEKLFGEGNLGRIEQARSGDISDILSQRKQQAQQGFGAEEFQAAREQRLQGLGRAEQAQLRALRAQQGAMGVRGG